MKKDIYQLVYVSESKYAFDIAELDALLEKANKRNKALDITGVLIYNRGTFIQLLEGRDGSVRNLFDIIKSDKRHGSVQEIFEQYTEKRLFEHWTMAFKKYEDLNLDVREKIDAYINSCTNSEVLTNLDDTLTLLKLVRNRF
jgi:hypothetical protein